MRSANVSKKLLLSADIAVSASVRLLYSLEDVFSELLYLSDYIPVLFIVDVFFDVIHYPVQKFIVHAQFLNHFIYGILFYLDVVQFHSEVCRKVEFACQIAQYALKEGVYGFNTEVAVIINDVVKCPSRSFGKEVL